MLQLDSDHNERQSAAARLRAKRAAILEDWESRIRHSVLPTDSLDRLILEDSLPAFIDNLAAALEKPHRPERLCFENECAVHARQRTELKGYQLEDVISEYHILASTILEHLEQDGPISTLDKEAILRFIDLALEEVTDNFIKNSTGKLKEADSASAEEVLRYQGLAKIADIIVICLSGATLLAWAIGSSGVAQLAPAETYASPIAALCLFALGVGALLLHSDIFTRRRLQVAAILAAFVILTSVFKIFQITAHQVPLELALLRGAQTPAGIHVQMTRGTAVSLISVSVALVFSGVRRRGTVTASQSLTLLAAAISSWYLIAYLYHLALPKETIYSSIGTHAAAMLVILAAGVLFSRPDQGIMAIVTSEGPGGYMARRMIPAAILVPIGLGWIRMLAQTHGIVDISVGAAFLIVAVVLIFTSLIWWLARQINILAQERRRYQRETVGALLRRDEMRSALEEIERERDIRERFVSALSHDLRGPLTAVKASADLGLRYPDRTEGHMRLFQRITDNVSRADQMIRDLLDANRIRAGQPLPIQIEECDLTEIVERVREELTFVHGDRIRVESDGSIRGYWSCESIRRIIENLSTNALKYGREGSVVTIALLDFGKEVEFSVHNFGNPIAPVEQSRIFDAFRRTESAERGRKTGWGLGLALVRGLAEVHGGRVSVRSSPDEGTTFVVLLPKDARPYQSKLA